MGLSLLPAGHSLSTKFRPCPDAARNRPNAASGAISTVDCGGRGSHFPHESRRSGLVRHGRGPLQHLRPRNARPGRLGRAVVQRRDVSRKAAADVLDHDGRIRDFRRQRVGRPILFGRFWHRHGPGGVPSRPNPLQRPDRALDRPDYRLDDHFHHFRPRRHSRFRADAGHHAGIFNVCDGMEGWSVVSGRWPVVSAKPQAVF